MKNKIRKTKKKETIEKYIEVLNYIIWKISPNYNDEGIDLHKNNIYFNSEILGKFGVTENYIKDEIKRLNIKKLNEVIKMIDDIREDKMLENSLTRKYDGGFAKFVLSNKYKYAEKSENINKSEMSFKDFKISDLIEIEEDKKDDE